MSRAPLCGPRRVDPAQPRPAATAGCTRRALAWLLLMSMAIATGTATAQAAPAALAATAVTAATPAAAVKVPQYRRVVLPNGITLLLMPIREVPLIAFTAVVRAGALGDPAGQAGLSALAAALLEKGAGARDAFQFADAVADVGGSLAAGAGPESVTVGGQFLARDRALMIELLADALLRPRFDPAEFETLRERRVQLIKADKLWMGVTIHSGDREFRVPDHYPLNAAGSRVDENGVKYIRVKGVRWYTNLDHGRRHQKLPLMTMADNIKFSKHKEVHGTGYERYCNFDALEVPFTDAIPSDFDGIMGVPITFLDRYDPDQFEIIANGDDRDEMEALGVPPLGPEYVGNAGRRKVGVPSTKKAAYKRILIRHLKPTKGKKK